MTVAQLNKLSDKQMLKYLHTITTDPLLLKPTSKAQVTTLKKQIARKKQ